MTIQCPHQCLMRSVNGLLRLRGFIALYTLRWPMHRPSVDSYITNVKK